MPFIDPAVWSDRLSQTLARYDESLLRTVTGTLFRPRNQWPAAELIERSLAAVGNPAVIDRRLKELEPAGRQVLALMAHSRQPCWHLGNIIELLMMLGHADGLPPVLTVLESGLVYPCLPDSVKRLKQFEQWLGQAGTIGLRVFAHPAVLARALGEDILIADFPKNPQSAIHNPQSTHEADGLEWPLRLGALWQQVAGSPLRRTQQGDFFKRDLERLAEDSLLTGAPADSLADVPDPGLLAVELAEIEGILEDNRGELRAAGLPVVWEQGLLPALGSLWAALPCVAKWNPLEGGANGMAAGRGNPYPSACLMALLLLSRLPPQGWAKPKDIEEWILERHPYWKGENVRPSQRRSWVGSFLLGFAYQLRMVQARKDADAEWLVRLSDTGRWLLGLAEAPKLATFPQTLTVQPNLEIVAYRQGLTAGLVAKLSHFGTWKSLGAACLLKLDAESVYRALQSGMTFAQIVQVLEKHGMRELPATVVDSLRTWAGKRERIAVYPSATLFEFASADDLNDALARGLPGVRLTERLAVVPGENGIEYRHFRLTGNRDYGLPPERCVEVDADGVTLGIDLARSDLLVETELRRFAEPADGDGPAPRPGPPGSADRRYYRMTLASLGAGRETGLSVRALEEWFVQRTGLALSPAARLLMTANQLGPAELRPHLVLHVAAPEVADGLLQWPMTRGLIAERLGPTALAVMEENAGELRQRLRTLGLTVQG
ncbi:hypothetical protein AYO44_00050 [Planctomycetaceae bacterium SCGC AG-212-F19]|nr:hypothetical protein AYO44_00050 [Planctomycetaceae bacterium SCGC AG-212-F19]